MPPRNDEQPRSHGVSDTIHRLESKVDTLILDVGDIKARLAAIEAAAEKDDARADDERTALFASRAKHDTRIGAIEANYTKRDVHDKLAEKVEEIKSRADKTAWAPSVLAAIGAGLLSFLGTLLAGGGK